MKAYKQKISVAVSTMLVVIGLAGRVNAYPLPTMDFKGIATQFQTYMIIALEVRGTAMRIVHIVKEIQHGGFGAAVNDLFGMIESGEFDRFGNNIKTLHSMAQADLYNVQTGLKASKEARQMRREGASKEEIAEAKAQKVAERQREYEEKQRQKEKIKEADTSRKKSMVSNAYNWLRENRQVTTAVRTGAMAAQYGDVAGMVSSAAMGAGGVLASGDRELVKDENGQIIGEKRTGGQVAGDILTNTAGYLGGATYAVQSGDYIGAATTAAAAAGAGFATGGKGTTAGIVANAGQAVGAAAQTVQNGTRNGENILEVGRDIMLNPYVQQGAINTGIYAIFSHERNKQEKAAAEQSTQPQTTGTQDNESNPQQQTGATTSTQQNSQPTQPQAADTQNNLDKAQQERIIQEYVKNLMNNGKKVDSNAAATQGQ